MSTPNPGTTPWVPMWNLNGGMDLRYQGDWAAGNYYDGDVVVYNGVLYMCVRPTSAAPKQWVQGVTTQGPYVRVARTSAQSIPTGAWTSVIWNLVRTDVGPSLHWSAANPTRLTCQVAGTYMVWGSAQFVPAAGGDTRQALILRNGGTITAVGGQSGSTLTAGGYPIAQTPELLQLNVGDYVELQLYQNSGAALNTNNSDTGGSQHAMEFGMALIGGVPGPQAQLASYGTQLPSNPTDGQEHVLVDSTTSPNYQWRFRYNAGNTTAYKWEFVGGYPLFSGSGGSYTNSAPPVNTWFDVSNPNPTLTVPRSGVYLLDFTVFGQSQAASGGYTMISSVLASTTGRSGIPQMAGSAIYFSGQIPFQQVVAYVAGETLKVQGQVNASVSMLMTNAWIKLTPLRIS